MSTRANLGHAHGYRAVEPGHRGGACFLTPTPSMSDHDAKTAPGRRTQSRTPVSSESGSFDGTACTVGLDIHFPQPHPVWRGCEQLAGRRTGPAGHHAPAGRDRPGLDRQLAWSGRWSAALERPSFIFSDIQVQPHRRGRPGRARSLSQCGLRRRDRRSGVAVRSTPPRRSGFWSRIRAGSPTTT